MRNNSPSYRDMGFIMHSTTPHSGNVPVTLASKFAQSPNRLATLNDFPLDTVFLRTDGILSDTPKHQVAAEIQM